MPFVFDETVAIASSRLKCWTKCHRAKLLSPPLPIQLNSMVPQPLFVCVCMCVRVCFKSWTVQKNFSLKWKKNLHWQKTWKKKKRITGRREVQDQQAVQVVTSFAKFTLHLNSHLKMIKTFWFNFCHFTILTTINNLVDSRPDTDHNPMILLFFLLRFPISNNNEYFNSEPLNHAVPVYVHQLIITIAYYFIAALTLQNQFRFDEAAHPWVPSCELRPLFFLDDAIRTVFHARTRVGVRWRVFNWTTARLIIFFLGFANTRFILHIHMDGSPREAFRWKMNETNFLSAMYKVHQSDSCSITQLTWSA